jgi:phosphate transport system substrate-binding protein
MRFLRIIVTACTITSATVPAAAAEIAGAGSTFVYPLLAQWSAAATTVIHATLDYQATGSGVGIRRIVNKTVTFGATDMPLMPADIRANQLVQFPLVSGAIVPVFNLPGVAPGALTLDGPTIAKIFLGGITRWNDPAIKRLNARITLPHSAIAVIHRSDASGTTFIWTDYLAKVSPRWRKQIGESMVVDWPIGVGTKGNEGVSSAVERTIGAFGYVEYAYARQNHLNFAKVVNRAGNAVSPTPAAFQAAAAGTDWSSMPDFRVVMTDALGVASWPIAGSTFILMQSVPHDPADSAAALKFFDWGYRHGSEQAVALGYVPMPQAAVTLIEKIWQQKIKTIRGGPVFQR